MSRATCDCCGVRSCAWTCEPCDFDLCERCGAAAFQINDAAIELEAPPTLPEEATPAEPEKVAAADTPTWLRTAASEVGIKLEREKVSEVVQRFQAQDFDHVMALHTTHAPEVHGCASAATQHR